MQTNQPEITKVILIGDSNVGKSCLQKRACREGFSAYGPVTVSLNYNVKNMDIDGKRIKVQLWITPCQERYESFNATLYKKISGVILCYAIDNKKSFERISHWIQQIDEYGGEDICKILVATKGDLELARVVEESEGRRLAESYGIGFVETSAREDRNVQEAVEMIVREVIRSRIKNKMGISLLKSVLVEPKKNKCC